MPNHQPLEPCLVTNSLEESAGSLNHQRCLQVGTTCSRCRRIVGVVVYLFLIVRLFCCSWMKKRPKWEEQNLWENQKMWTSELFMWWETCISRIF